MAEEMQELYFIQAGDKVVQISSIEELELYGKNSDDDERCINVTFSSGKEEYLNGEETKFFEKHFNASIGVSTIGSLSLKLVFTNIGTPDFSFHFFNKL